MHLLRLLFVSLLFFTGSVRGAEALPFAHEGSDLKPDAAAHFGTLANGLRYVVLPNHEPKNRVSMRLLVLAGSLHETEEQRGLAHFLEHMAFNGSTHYAPGTLIEFFQRMGMSFGGDTNASTSFDRTLYLLELAHSDDATVAEGLRVFSDYAGGLLLLDAEIEKERGVILSEKRVSDSVGYRTFIAQFDAMLGNTLLPKRIPIGLADVISKASRAQFTDFWDTWYRPEKMAVVVVGDFANTEAVEKMVTTAFSGMTARAPARPEPSLGTLTKFDEVRAVFHAEPEAPSTSISVTSLTPYSREPDTAARQLKLLPRSMALSMLNRRFSILAKKENAPFVSAGASVSESFDFLRQASVDVSCKPDQWQAAMAVGEQELRRALEHGFTAAELKESVANFTNSLEQSVKTASTRHSNQLASELSESLLSREVFTTPADDLALFKPALETITPADCLVALRANFAANGRYLLVTGNAKIEGKAEETIAAAYQSARSVAVSAPTAEQESEWAYVSFGTPGTVTKREHIADLDLELVTFSNGVRLNLKKTDFEAGRIRLSARIGNGTITEPADQRGLAAIALSTFGAGGLGKHSTDDLRKILAGKNVGVQFRGESDAFGFSGGTTREDLLLELQWLGAQITDAGYRPEALRQARKGIEQLYLSLEHTPNGPLSTEVANLLAGGDPRFGLPAKEVMMARNLDEVKAWLAPQLSKGAIEVGIIGDLDIDATIAAAAQTLGALPPRDPRPALDELKKITFPAQPFAKDYLIPTEIPKGALSLFWPTTDSMDVKRGRRLNMLAAVFNDRLRVKVREEIGGTYSPNAYSSSSETFPGYGYIMASIDVDPAMAGKISDLVITLADELASNGVTEDELNRARQPLLTSMKDSLRSNAYWLGRVLARAQEKPETLDWTRTRLSDVESITTADLNALAKEYLGRGRVSRATVLPAAAPEKK
ncbi:MAG: peptidase domain protein [Chthoniobacteraceae bacterium]|nr:peptidase domain protein [Chthoniobacteraceae bacterium]